MRMCSFLHHASTSFMRVRVRLRSCAGSVRRPEHNAVPWRAGVAGCRLYLGRALDRTHPDFHLDARPQAVEHRDEPVSREASEVGMANAREIGRGNAGTSLRDARRQAFPVQGFDNLGGEDRLELLGIRVDPAKISEHIAAARYDLQLVSLFHVSISLRLLQRRLDPRYRARLPDLGHQVSARSIRPHIVIFDNWLQRLSGRYSNK